MKSLILTHNEMTRENLLQAAEEIPGAWEGIRIAAYLLLLSGWKTTEVANLFEVTRWAVVKVINKANEGCIKAVEDNPRTGRPSQFDSALKKELEEALTKSPKEFGIPRVRWDGKVFVEYILRFYKKKITIRHAQRLIRELGFSLRQPIYRYVQATEEGVEEFRSLLKKTSPAQKKQRRKSDPV